MPAVLYELYLNHLQLLSLFIQVGIHYLDRHVFIASNHMHRRRDLIAIRSLNANSCRLKKNLNVHIVRTKVNVRIIYDSTCLSISSTQKIQWKFKVVDSKYIFVVVSNIDMVFYEVTRNCDKISISKCNFKKIPHSAQVF